MNEEQMANKSQRQTGKELAVLEEASVRRTRKANVDTKTSWEGVMLEKHANNKHN